MFLSVLYFFAIICLLGVSTVSLVTGRMRLTFGTYVLSTGVGLATFGVLAFVLNVMGVPLTWWTFLLAGAALLAAALLRRRRGAKTAEEAPPPGESSKSDLICLLAAILLAGVTFGIFLNGTFSFKWLPDDDSWEHAASAKYVAIHHTYTITPEARAYPTRSYLEPYPPAYPVLMGVLHQINPSIHRTLKVFNVILIALGIVYFHLMMREWTGNPRKALWMTGVLWVLPCFMSHFIWAQSLALILFFPAFYALERARREASWAIIAAICIGGILLTQPSCAAVFGILAAIYWVVNLAFTIFGREGRFPAKALLGQALAGVGGLLIAAAFYLPGYLKFGRSGFLWGLGKWLPTRRVTWQVSGTSHGKVYSLWEFMWAPTSTKINQPPGLGLVLSLVLAAGVVLILARPGRLRKNRYPLVALVWLLFTILGIQGNSMPMSLFPHRFWAFLAIPVALVAGEFLSFLASKLTWKTASLAVAFGMALGLVFVFGTVAERFYQRFGSERDADLASHDIMLGLHGLRLGLFLTVLLGSIASLAAGLVALVGGGRRAGPYVRFFLLALLVAGVMVTSGYAKGRFEGFSEGWPGGVFFYQALLKTPDGQLVVRVRDRSGRIVRVPFNRLPPEIRQLPPEKLRRVVKTIADPQHVMGFVEIRREFDPDTRILGVTCLDRHIIGFDMFTPPYDLEVAEFKETLRWMSVEEMDAGAARRIHDFALRRDFDYVMLSPYRAAKARFAQRGRRKKLGTLLKESGVSDARLRELCPAGAKPTQPELRSLGEIRAAVRQLSRLDRLRREGTPDEAAWKTHVERLLTLNADSGITPSRFEELFPTGMGTAPPETFTDDFIRLAVSRMNDYARPTPDEARYLGALREIVAQVRDYGVEAENALRRNRRLRRLLSESTDLFATKIARKSQPAGISLFRVKKHGR